MVGLRIWYGVVGMRKWGWFLLLASWVLLSFSFFCPLAQADPPEPKTHYKFEAWPNGTIVLYFQEDGYRQKFMYQQLIPTQPATNCANKYFPSHMELITLTQPYWYIADLTPFMKWEPIEKEWVKIEEVIPSPSISAYRPAHSI